MSPEERQNVQCFWNALVIAGALYSLGYGIISSLFISAIILISTLIGYGRRYLIRAGWVLMVVAIAVAIGLLPPPPQWLPALKTVQVMISGIICK